jgi:uncharacterized protein YlaI
LFLHKNNPGAVKSGDLAGQGMLPVLEIRQLGNIPRRTFIAMSCERTRSAFTGQFSPGAVKSGDLAGQEMLPVLEIRQLGNIPLRTFIASRCA